MAPPVRTSRTTELSAPSAPGIPSWRDSRELRPYRRRRVASRHLGPPSLLLVVQLARNALPCFRGWARLHLYARSDRPAPARRRLHRSRDARRARDDEQEVVTMAAHANTDLSPRVRARVSGARMTSEARPRCGATRHRGGT